VTARVLDLDGADRLVSLVGEIAAVCTGSPFPVGARVELRLGGAAAGAVTGKVVDARRSSEGFRLRIRLFNLSRAVRELLAVRAAADSAERPAEASPGASGRDR
jgi:hypothetical protein